MKKKRTIIPIGDLERLYPTQVNADPSVARSFKRQRAVKRLMVMLNKMQKGSERFTEEEVEADVRKAGHRIMGRRPTTK